MTPTRAPPPRRKKEENPKTKTIANARREPGQKKHRIRVTAGAEAGDLRPQYNRSTKDEKHIDLITVTNREGGTSRRGALQDGNTEARSTA